MLRQITPVLNASLEWMARQVPMRCHLHSAPNAGSISSHPTYQFINKQSPNSKTQRLVTAGLKASTSNATSVPALNTLAHSRLTMERTRMMPFNRNTNTHNYYQLLGVPTNAKAKDIKAAYYLLAKQCHPDAKSKTDAKARKKFLDISEAYAVLSDEVKRAEYDQQGMKRHGSMVKPPERTDTFSQSAESVKASGANASTGE